MVDTNLDKKERQGFPNSFKDLQKPFEGIKSKFIETVSGGDLEEKYGLTDESPSYKIYHATTDKKLKKIKKKGLKAFPEKDDRNPRVFVTPSPTLALWHAITNKPHDTQRKLGKISENEAEGNPVLLEINIDKKWLENQPDAKKLPDREEYVWLFANEEKIGNRKPGQNNRINTFRDKLQEEVKGLKRGDEASEDGIPFPTDTIPPNFIKVIKK